METYNRPCGHKLTVEADNAFDLFGATPPMCDDCLDTKRLYDHVFVAMRGNVYSLAILAEAGLIPVERPSLKDLDDAGNRLFARLTPAVREITAQEAISALECIKS